MDNKLDSLATLRRQARKTEDLFKFSYKDSETLVKSECLSV